MLRAPRVVIHQGTVHESHEGRYELRASKVVVHQGTIHENHEGRIMKHVLAVESVGTTRTKQKTIQNMVV